MYTTRHPPSPRARRRRAQGWFFTVPVTKFFRKWLLNHYSGAQFERKRPWEHVPLANFLRKRSLKGVSRAKFGRERWLACVVGASGP